jgi:hypothetical protein
VGVFSIISLLPNLPTYGTMATAFEIQYVVFISLYLYYIMCLEAAGMRASSAGLLPKASARKFSSQPSMGWVSSVTVNENGRARSETR